MLGHTLRGVEDSPAYLSILFAINAESDINFIGRGGRPSLNLLDMIRNDHLKFSTFSFRFWRLKRAIAIDRVKWKSFEKMNLLLRQLPRKFLELLFSDILNLDMVYNHTSLKQGLTNYYTPRHLVTSGMDRRVRIWDVRSYKECVGYLRNTPTPASHLTVSQTGMVAIAHGGHVQVTDSQNSEEF